MKTSCALLVRNVKLAFVNLRLLEKNDKKIVKKIFFA